MQPPATPPSRTVPEFVYDRAAGAGVPIAVEPLLYYVYGDEMDKAVSAHESTVRFETVVTKLAAGGHGYDDVLAFMQFGALQNSGMLGHEPAVTQAMHDAFAGAVRDGSWTPSDTAALVAAESAPGHSLMLAVGSVSGYLANLTGPHADETRAAFARESVAQAEVAHTPEVSGLFYAQAASALGAMAPAALKHTLDEMRASDPNAIARLAYGATGGTTLLAEREDAVNRLYPGAVAANGLGSMIRSLADSGARPELVDAVSGVSQYLSEKEATAAERSLLANDGKTGLRDALEHATRFEPGMRSNFEALLQAYQQGDGLSPNGMNLFANLARAEMGGSAHDADAKTFGATIGNVVGHIAVDLARSTPGSDAALRQDFGRDAFGERSAAAQESAAARTLGNIIGQLKNGLDQDFDGRNDAAVNRQAQITGTIATISAVVGAAGRAPGPQAGALGTFAATLGVIQTQIPRDHALTSEEAQATLRTLTDGVQTLLARDPALLDQFKNGLSDATTWGRDDDQQRARTNASQAAAQAGGFAGRFVRDIVSPEPREPAPAALLTPRELTPAVRSAVEAYNADPERRGPPLPPPRDEASVRAWNDGTHRPQPTEGTLLKLDVKGEEEFALYAVHGGRGTFTVVDPTKDLAGYRPDDLVGLRVHLDANGTLEPVAHAPQLAR
jgi:hypothetical protein